MKHLNVALLVFLDGNGNILLSRRADADEEMWEVIGGGIEKDESPADAIVREVSEELNYDLNESHDELKALHYHEMSTENFTANVHYFSARFPGLENFSDSDEVFVRDLKLYPISEALNLTLLPMTRVVLEGLVGETVRESIA